jgi:hypothetical protein
MSLDASAQAGKSSNRTQSFVSNYLSPLLKLIFGVGTLFTFFWGVYTYSVDQAQRSQQNLITAFDLIDTHIGEGKTLDQMVLDATAPISASTDDTWSTARTQADISDGEKKATEIDKIKRWIVSNILVKGGGKEADKNIYNYQVARDVFDFLNRFANISPCNAEVVVFRFRKTAYTFFYYYPEKYSFSSSHAEPENEDANGPQRLGNKDWGDNQANECDKMQQQPMLPLVGPLVARLFWY